MSVCILFRATLVCRYYFIITLLVLLAELEYTAGIQWDPVTDLDTTVEGHFPPIFP